MNEGPLAHSGGYAFPRAARLTRPEDIRRLFRRGKRRKTRHLDVFVSASPVAYPRVAIVVPKPRGKTALGRRGARGPAVQRNRMKRRLREIARRTVLPDLRERSCPVDLLVRARPEAFGASYAELREDLAFLGEWMCSNAR